MFKQLTIAFIAITSIAFAGCATVQDTVNSLIPAVEAKLGVDGVQFSVDIGLDMFCVNEDGFVYNGVNSIPFIGTFILGALPVCEPEVE